MTDATSRNPFRWVVRMPRARPRLLAAIGVGIIVGVSLAFLGTGIDRSTRLILSWDALAVTFLGSMMLSMIQHSPTEIRARAVLDDEGKGVILGLVLVAAAASVWAVGDELSLAKDAHGLVKLGRIVLAFGTVIASWMMVQMIFALHYAHEYYG